MSYKHTLFSILALFPVIFQLVHGNEDSPSVIIIGAGAAGIAAASKLLQNGFKNITILEAQDRIGGRIHTIRFADYWTDMGGQWVHEKAEDVAFELAWSLGLLENEGLDNKTRQYELFDSSGKLIPFDDILLFYTNTTENLPDYAKKANESMGEYFKNEFNKYFEAHPEWNKKTKEVLHFFDMLQMSDDGGDTWWDVSIKGILGSVKDFSINWKERGYSTILDILMKRYPNPEEELPIVKNTILNAEVSLINNKETDGKVSVTTTKGDTYSADHVIVTASLGVLKEYYTTLFQPPLPEEKIKTIKTLGFGSAAKIYLAFEEPWWNDTTSGINFLWADEDMALLENDPEKSWLLGLVGFYCVEHRPRLLLGWVAGKYSRDLEKLSEQQVFNHTVEALQRFVGSSYNVTTPTGMIRTMWNSNKYVRGVYSYRTTKADAENVWHATLAEPIGNKKPVVLFAGEATNPKSYGSVHGAIETGRREADRLIQLYPNLGPVKTTTPLSA